MKIRCKFRKTGYLKFIGHLDVMRTFQKVMRRAEIDVQYSAGFSPHQKMTFATPLGLGAVSVGEYMDVEVGACPPKQEFIDLLNAVSVPELAVLDASLLPDDAKNAMSLIAAADYEVSFREGKEPDDLAEFFDGMLEFYDRPEIVVTKATKKNTVEVDLRKQIRLLKRRGDRLFMRVDTGSASNLKPELLFATYAQSIGKTFLPTDVEVLRLELYGEGEDGLKPLLDFGVKDF